ncbi:nuclear transport factor 2 family protein [Solilutibacter silvestris]|uniref:nuclear transport factor 2 family protein n=1 Tax=Solilutibacter silvestris TaxID=1645665 RepID=UPI003D33A446
MAIQSNADKAIDFLGLCTAGQVRRAYSEYVSEGFKHHNAYFPSDRESLLLAMEESAKSEPNKSFTVKQIFESRDRVATLSHVRRENADIDIAVVHILRFEDGKIVEMWDIGQQIPSDSPNKLGMF